MIKKSFSTVFFSRPNVTYTFQALSEEDRKLWMDAMDGKEPVSVSMHFNDIRMMIAFNNIIFLSFMDEITCNHRYFSDLSATRLIRKIRRYDVG